MYNQLIARLGIIFLKTLKYLFLLAAGERGRERIRAVNVENLSHKKIFDFFDYVF